MATTLVTPDPAAPTTYTPRMLAIAVNLLPPEIVESRQGRRVRRVVLSALAAFTVLLGVWYGLASYQTSSARDEVSGAQGDVERLARLQKPFASLISAQNESRAIGAQLSSLLAGDLQWAHLLSSLREAAPEGVRITTVAGGLSSPDGGSGAAVSRLPNTSGQKVIGTLTVTGSAPSKAAVAEYLDALAKVPGFANPLLDTVTAPEKTADFSLRLDITNSALGGRYPTTNESKGR
jgi:Tfp pilus assembly protein PilN